jgi:ABC-type multidrug transport system fused ATPase/permease subunit
MTITKAISASVAFFEMIDSKGVPSEGAKAPEVSAHEDIEMKGVTFAYPSRPGVQVLQSFDAVFKRGQITALVGPSGSGKSTIVGLLERWYSLKPEEVDAPVSSSSSTTEEKESDDSTDKIEKANNSGAIICGGHEVESFNLKWWRSQIGFVQQEPFLFNDTIMRNVSFGLLGTEWENVSDEEKLERVKQACKEAYADEFVEKLPQGEFHSIILHLNIIDDRLRLPDNGRRIRHQVVWWTETTTRNRTEHHSPTRHLDPGRGNQCNRCPQRSHRPESA